MPDSVVGDPSRLRQVLLNLLSNAVKFTEQGSVCLRVAVQALSQKNCRIQFTVKDTGIGIPIEAQPRLFEAFTQVDSSTSRRFGRTGLGLTIAKRLVEILEGSLGLESTVGKGSTFWFAIPFSVGTSIPDILLRRVLNGKRILVVDDSAAHRLLSRKYLEWAGASASEASTGSETLTHILAALRTDQPFSLILLDLHMPKIDGLTLARTIRHQAECKNLPLLLLGSSRDADTATEARELGITGFLVKPVRRAHFLEAIARALRTEDEQVETSGTITYSPELHILLAENHPANQLVVTLLLKQINSQTHLATNGLKAIEACLDQQYDLILMDCQTPTMDGFTAASEIRRRTGPNQATPIIALTANVLKESRERCIEAGMNDYLAKPVNRTQLYEMIQKWVINSSLQCR